jgi:trigger factor
VKTEVKPVAENEVELAVEVPRDDVEAKVERTISRLARETTIPGFRKGKVPRQIVLSRLGEDYVLGQTLNDFLPEWYESALDEAELEPVSTPEIDFGDFTGKEPFAFTAKVQVRPEPVLGKYTGLEVARDTAEITDAQVEAQLAMLQERFASLKPVEGRAAVKGDFVQIDFAGTVDGAPLEGARAEDYMLEVGQGNLIPGFEGHLEGLAAGEATSFDLEFPDDYQAEDLQGKPVTFAATMKEIKEKVVPPLDDDFAQQASEFDTLAALRDDVRARLSTARESMVEREYRNRVVEQAAANATVTIPPAMIDRQAHALYHEFESAVGERGLEIAQYLEALGKTEQETEAELRPRAAAEVKRGLVLAAIRDAEKIEVSDDELRRRITEDAEVLQRDPSQLVLDVYASGRQNMLRDELVIAKTIDFLVDHATPVSSQTAAGESDAKDQADDESADTTGKAAGRAGAAGKTGRSAGKASAPRRRARKTSDE